MESGLESAIDQSPAKTKISAMSGDIFDIQRFSINDGPGIRTTVFLKGCPLNCFWCCNPESQLATPELLYLESLCTRCGRCAAVCTNGATRDNQDGLPDIDRARCVACGECVKHCTAGARSIAGRTVTVAELMETIRKDQLFYRNSGGGVTLSGGEPTVQSQFCQALLAECHRWGVNTVLDTCGYVRWEVLKPILAHVDLVHYDLKHLEDARHMVGTGVSNEIILNNVRRIAKCGIPIVIRVPLIPGYNDTSDHIDLVGRFVESLNVARLDLLPYHQLGVNKYRRIGREYPAGDMGTLDEASVPATQRRLESFGLDVTIG